MIQLYSLISLSDSFVQVGLETHVKLSFLVKGFDSRSRSGARVFQTPRPSPRGVLVLPAPFGTFRSESGKVVVPLGSTIGSGITIRTADPEMVLPDSTRELVGTFYARLYNSPTQASMPAVVDGVFMRSTKLDESFALWVPAGAHLEYFSPREYEDDELVLLTFNGVA
jgi:hypothetical protein